MEHVTAGPEGTEHTSPNTTTGRANLTQHSDWRSSELKTVIGGADGFPLVGG